MRWNSVFGVLSLVLFENSKPNQLPRRIALVDCNNFYASCERVFKPAWNNRPLGVLSNNDGCIIARSNELKAAGIPMGAPYFKCKAALDQMGAIVVSSNYSLYGDMSSRVMDTLARYTPDIEIYSIDEAWLDLTGFPAETLDAYGRQIVAETHQYTGIPVSMGIAPTKVLAKLANRICKKRNIPGQVFNIGSAHALDDILRSVAVEDVWGIGRKLSKKLNEKHHIFTALDLRNADPYAMRRHYSVVMQRLIMELRGEPCLFFDEVEPKQQIIASRSFGERVTQKQDLYEAVSTHTARACEKLRAQGSVASGINVSIRTGAFQEKAHYYGKQTSIHFATPTANTSQMIQAAQAGVDTIFKQGPRYAKAGIMLFNIQAAGVCQYDLFDEQTTPESDDLMGTIDAINKRYGKKTVFFGAQGINNRWAMKRNQMTNRFTTSWDELVKV